MHNLFCWSDCLPIYSCPIFSDSNITKDLDPLSYLKAAAS